ncbi:MAG: carboxymuconolactone decarboxylase family protein [Haloferacaceae archaeon]
MSIENPLASGPRVDPVPPEDVQEILEDAPEAAKANMERAEAILGALEDDEVPDTYDSEEDWGFTFTGLFAHDPETFELWWAEEGHVFADGELDRGFKELLGALIAHERGASICIAWHTTSAKLEDVDPDRFLVAEDFENRKDDLPERERRALEVGLASVQRPEEVTDGDVQDLRDLGYSDAAVVELVATAGTAAKFANFALTLAV